MEFNLEKDVCIPKHSLLQRDYKELRLREVLLYHFANVLRVLKIKSGVDLIENVQGSRLVL